MARAGCRQSPLGFGACEAAQREGERNEGLVCSTGRHPCRSYCFLPGVRALSRVPLIQRHLCRVRRAGAMEIRSWRRRPGMRRYPQ